MKTLKQLSLVFLSILPLLFPSGFSGAEEMEKVKVKPSGRTVIAEVVAFDQPFMLNRLGAQINSPTIFALRKDVATCKGKALPGYNEDRNLSDGYAGNVQLKEYKRPRPIVLRANVGDILEIRFTNLLRNQTAGQFAGCRVMGLSLAESIDSDSSWVGKNPTVMPPNPPTAPLTTPKPADGSFAKNANQGGATMIYRYFVDAEGVFILYSAADPTGFQGSTNEVGHGLFGCVIVQPPNAEYYRSEVLRTDLNDATYYSGNLPENMLLHRAPDDEKGGKHWFLTTYRTRLHDFVTKNVEVVIGEPEVIQQLHGPASQEQIEKASKKTDYLQRSADGSFVLMAPGDKNSQEHVQKQKEGDERLDGYIYSRDTGHPLIDYGIAYSKTKRARPPAWPVLQMVYPEVKPHPEADKNPEFPKHPECKNAVPAQRDDERRGIKKGDFFYTLKESPTTPVAELEKVYASAITQLDTGTVPRELWPVLNDWGITSMSNLTRVGPQRGYFDPTLDNSKPVPDNGTANYIWLLTGVNLNGTPSSSVIIRGNRQNRTLCFLEVELQLFHSDLTAIITGPQAGGFGNMQQTPSAFLIPSSPDRMQPYREFALGYHNSPTTQAFPQQSGGPLSGVLGNGGDGFCINYGSAGISAEIMANRLGVGPQGVNQDSVDLKFEEFFLSSWAVGDPAMLVDRPANAAMPPPPCNATPTPTSSGTSTPAPSYRATKVFYPDDPSNVYHSYMRDHVKMRIYNAGESAPHVHHLHAHQWLRSPNSDEASYLDSQLIVPGSAFTLEITYNGSGNRNQTVGDSIFHCHFYPHFAQGMWSLWRVHDVFEEGTLLDPNTGGVLGDPAKWVRALPDGEIGTGTPIPAIVPLPTLAMPPIPPPVRVTTIPEFPKDPAHLAGGKASADNLKKWMPSLDKSMGRMTEVKPDVDEKGKTRFDEKRNPQFSNPGYPFFVPGVAGHRPPHPPLDMGWEENNGVPIFDDGNKIYLDGGLPRHQVLGGQIVREFHTPWDFTKDYIRYADKENRIPADGAMVAYRVPEDGTPIEKAAMKAHETRTVTTVQPDGRQGNFIHNGLARTNGAPFSDPGVDDQGNAVRSLRKYKAAVIQKDVVFNKAGWHYPQQRFITLWQDVKPTFDEKRPAQPFFFRANSGETVEYWHTNLVPEYYELDDFQVRTPTDIIGQHIHLVKFDVLASDGAVNGFNYEDGTTSADDVRGRIYAITRPWTWKAPTSNLVNTPPAKPIYSLFELSQPQAGKENYVAGIDWSRFVAKVPVPTPWNHSYLQWQMSREAKPLPRDAKVPNPLTPEFPYPEPPPGQNWDGAMTTIQRFSTDPLLNDQGIDRTVRTVFTHDHFGPSTHQQAGLYAGFLVEPEKSVWRDPVTGGLLYNPVTRTDGGPTGWEAIIEPQNLSESYREFAIEFQDLQLAYNNQGGKMLTQVSTPSLGAFGSIQIPTPNLPNPTIKLVNKFTFTYTDGGQSITTNLKDYLGTAGISLTDAAIFVTASSGVNIVDEGDNLQKSFYVYPGKNAFSLQMDAPNKQLLLRPLYLETWSVPNTAINPEQTTSNSGVPQIISSGGGTYSVNYRNEPLNVSLNLPSPPPTPTPTPVGRVGPSGPGPQNDMAFAFASIEGRTSPWNITLPSTNPPPGQSPVPVAPLFARFDEAKGQWVNPVEFAQAQTGVNDGKISNWDPYTPLLRGYQGDKVQVRALVGAHTQPHSFTIHGLKWLAEMMSINSGFKNGQEMGISEHFEFQFELPPASTDTKRTFADYLYAPSSGTTGLSNGTWGIVRSFDNPPKAADSGPPIASLRRLPEEANPRPYQASHPLVSRKQESEPAFVPNIEYTISALSSQISYNDANSNFLNQTGMVYKVTKVQAKVDNILKEVLFNTDTKDVVALNHPKPLILRARAGDWVRVILNNKIDKNKVSPGDSGTVGLHADLPAYDVSTSDGANVGFNPNQTVAVGDDGSKEYLWYAGDLEFKPGAKPGEIIEHPRELGAVNLCPAAPLHQDGNGLLGALIVEPKNATWKPDDYLSASADILDSSDPKGSPLFREFVLIQQTNIAIEQTKIPGNTLTTSAVNNQDADPLFRLSASPTPTPPLAEALSNSLQPVPPGGPPNTPTFVATAGDRVRFRVLQPGGDSIGQNIMFEIHGHSWQQEPWIKSSTELGDNPKSNVLGADILVPHKALNILMDSAGGPNAVPGDYLYYNYLAGDGAWGIFRVEKKK